MLLDLMGSSLVYTNVDVVFDESLITVDPSTEFRLDVSPGFNSDITFPSYAESIRIGGSPYNYNHVLNFPNNVHNTSYLFSGCYNYNQPTPIPNTINNCAYMFNCCYNFNKPVSLPNPDASVNMYCMFNGCRNFNQPLNLDFTYAPVSVYSMLSGCNNFNSVVNISNVCSDLSGLFRGLNNYNQPTVIPDNVVNVTSMFTSSKNFNQPISIPDSVVNGSFMLQEVTSFNQPVVFSNNLKYGTSMFAGAYTFDQTVILPQGMIDCNYMFQRCTTFNHIAVIPSSVTYAVNMFALINSVRYNTENSGWYPQSYEALRNPIYFYANSIISASSMFAGSNTMTDLYLIGLKNNYQLQRFMRINGINRCNIYTDDISKEILYNTSILNNGGKPTWTNDNTNGCIYNTLVNIYIYNNWDGTLPTI